MTRTSHSNEPLQSGAVALPESLRRHLAERRRFFAQTTHIDRAFDRRVDLLRYPA